MLSELKQKVSEILDNAKQRFASPLFYSFLISWCVVNWHVAFGIIWYDSKGIKDLGYKTVFDFITTNTYSPFWHPLGYALLYVFIISPFVTNFSDAWGALLNRFGNDLAFKAAGNAPISVQMYRQSQEAIKQVHDQYSDIINNATEKDRILTEAQTNLTQTKQQLAESQTTVARTNDLLNTQQAAFNELNSRFDDLKKEHSRAAHLMDQINKPLILEGRKWQAVNTMAQTATIFEFGRDTALVTVRHPNEGKFLSQTGYNIKLLIYDPTSKQFAITLTQDNPKWLTPLSLQAVITHVDFDESILQAEGFLNNEKIKFKPYLEPDTSYTSE